MAWTTLIDADTLSAHLGHPDWRILDCRFSLDATQRGESDYTQAHIPGALYAHMDRDLSSPVIPGRTGRHPLPEAARFANTLSDWGIDQGVQVVVYDDAGGAYASRLWWMVRWLGHDAVAVLDGGWPAWQAQGLPTSAEVPAVARRHFTARLRDDRQVGVETVERIRTDGAWRLVDARSADRYRGENETIDPVAGHIPGALSLPYGENLDENGRFLSRQALAARFQKLLGDHPASRTVFYCGSGVTACHDILAYAHAGLGDARLYAGAWSHWITDPARPVAVGAMP